jgi:glutaredoxin 3
VIPPRVSLRLLAALLALAAVGCRKPKPEVPAAAASLPPLEITAEPPGAAATDARAVRWLYTYADAEGRFVTTDDPKSVPAGSRRLVRVTEPARAGERHEGVAVYVADLDALASKGRVQARVVSREAFESGALAQLPPGESSVFPGVVPGPPAVPPGAAPAAGSPAAAPGAPVVVTLYGTSWCPACKAARQYLREQNVPFAEKDIERDPVAARELREKAARLGVPADRIPILDVRGRLLIGFDKARLQALLGEAS